jgi:flagellar hook-length control protein FliK
MQSPALGPVNLMPAVPSAHTSTANTGQDGIFAAHLAGASREQTTTVHQEPRGRQESSTTSLADKSSDSENITINDDSTDELSLDATMNGSAGAAMLPVQLISANAEFTANRSIVPTQGKDSIVTRMLNALTSNTDNAKAAVQTFTSQEGQSPPNPLMTSPKNSGAATLSGPSFSEGSGIIHIDNTTVQSRATVSVVADTAPTTEVTSATGPIAPATVSVTGQSQIAEVLETGQTGQTATAAVTTQAQTAEARTTAQQDAVQKGIDQIVQNKYGQIITIHQSSEAGEVTPTTAAAGTTAGTGTNHRNLDITGNYIQAHLPNDAPRTTEKDGNSQQQETAKDNQQKDANTAKITTGGQAQPEQAVSQKFQIAVGQENQPLIFAHQQASAAFTASTDSTSSTSASMLRLPSGLFVPSGTIVDQMIAHFAVNRQMESSSVNIKLHPQELGELRMEIKVHQDNIKAHIIAQNPQAEEMINRHLPRLREALEQQGLHLQQIDVTVAPHDNNSGKERFQEHADQQQLRPSMQNRNSQPVFAIDTGEATEEAANNLSVLA